MVHHKLRKQHNNRLLRVHLRSRSVTQRIHNVSFAGLSSSNDSSKTNSDVSSVRPVRRKLNVRRDLCDSNNPRVNASQHQRDRNHSNNDAQLFRSSGRNHKCVVNQHQCVHSRLLALNHSRDLLLHLVRSRSRSNSKSRKRLDVLPQPNRLRAVVKAKARSPNTGTQMNADLNPDFIRVHLRLTKFAKCGVSGPSISTIDPAIAIKATSERKVSANEVK